MLLSYSIKTKYKRFCSNLNAAFHTGVPKNALTGIGEGVVKRREGGREAINVARHLGIIVVTNHPTWWVQVALSNDKKYVQNLKQWLYYRWIFFNLQNCTDKITQYVHIQPHISTPQYNTIFKYLPYSSKFQMILLHNCDENYTHVLHIIHVHTQQFNSQAETKQF